MSSGHDASRNRSALVGALLLGAMFSMGCEAFTPRSPASPAFAEASTSGAQVVIVEEAQPVERAEVEVVASEPIDASNGAEEPTIEASREPAEQGPRFFDQADGPILEALANEPIVRIERGRGGRSIGFKVWFANGMRGYFKPQQSAGSTRWYAEVAAYHLDRELGLGRTAPSVVRTVPFSRLRQAAGTDARVDEIVSHGGAVRGAMIFWITGPLERAPLDEGWEHWVRINSDLPAIDPFVAPPHFRRAEARASRLTRLGRVVPERAAPFAETVEDTGERPAELSDLVVFDYLTANQDRWGGEYTNVRTRGEGGPIVYLDNGAGFRSGARQRDALLDARIETVERFRARTLDAVRALDVADFADRLEEHGIRLNRRQRAGLAARQAHVLEHVEAMQAEHGEAALPW